MDGNPDPVMISEACGFMGPRAKPGLAGQLLKIEVLDHVIIGNGNRSSLRELGYFYT